MCTDTGRCNYIKLNEVIVKALGKLVKYHIKVKF